MRHLLEPAFERTLDKFVEQERETFSELARTGTAHGEKGFILFVEDEQPGSTNLHHVSLTKYALQKRYFAGLLGEEKHAAFNAELLAHDYDKGFIVLYVPGSSTLDAHPAAKAALEELEELTEPFAGAIYRVYSYDS